MSSTTTMPPQMAEATRQVGREVERPKASDVAKQIRTECQALGRSCSLRQAKRLIRMLRRATAHARSADYQRTYHLRQHELYGLHYVLDAVMPDDVVVPRPGSAHEMLQQLLLDGREFALVHTRDGADQCVVAVRTAIV